MKTSALKTRLHLSVLRMSLSVRTRNASILPNSVMDPMTVVTSLMNDSATSTNAPLVSPVLSPVRTVLLVTSAPASLVRFFTG